MKPTVSFRYHPVAAVLLLGASLLFSACDSTPRERQDAVQEGANKIDNLADRAGDVIERVGSRAARWDSVGRARNAQPLDTVAANTFAQNLLGANARIEGLSVENLVPAYTQLLRETREQRRSWTQRDWDYATAVFRRLNARYRAVRLDLPARQELRIKTLQAEFEGLETSRDLKDLGEAVRDKPASAR